MIRDDPLLPTALLLEPLTPDLAERGYMLLSASYRPSCDRLSCLLSIINVTSLFSAVVTCKALNKMESCLQQES